VKFGEVTLDEAVILIAIDSLQYFAQYEIANDGVSTAHDKFEEVNLRRFRIFEKIDPNSGINDDRH